MHPHTITTSNVAPDFLELAEILGDRHLQMQPVHNGEAVNHFKLHPTSIAYTSNVFKQHLLLLIGIWMHPYTFTTKKITPFRVDWKHS